MINVENYRKYLNTTLLSLQIVLIMYSVQRLNSYQIELRTRLDQMLPVLIRSLENSKDILLKNISIIDGNICESSSKIEIHLSKIQSVLQSLDIQKLNIVNNSDAVNKTILQMLEVQRNSQPVITIVNESHTRPLVVCALIIFASALGCVWWYAPKISFIAVSQFNSLQWVVGEILRYLPGSNSANAITYLPKLSIHITTIITKGVPHHSVYHTQLKETYDLETYLMKFLLNDYMKADVVSSITKTGLEFGGLL